MRRTSARPGMHIVARSTGCDRNCRCIRPARALPMSSNRLRRPFARWARPACRWRSPSRCISYPFCVLQCVPIPLLSGARLKRALLLRTIRNRSLLLANTGSERIHGTTTPLSATRTADGLYINGRCEYLSLSSVADIVLFKAELADSNHTVLCAADLRASSVRIGQWKFSGTMELSDTSSVTFADHRVPERALPGRAGSRGTRLHLGLPALLVPSVHRGDLSRASRAPA